jgi:hypothetical protein
VINPVERAVVVSTRNTVEREIGTPRPASIAAPARPANVIASRPTVAVSRSVRRAYRSASSGTCSRNVRCGHSATAHTNRRTCSFHFQAPPRHRKISQPPDMPGMHPGATHPRTADRPPRASRSGRAAAEGRRCPRPRRRPARTSAGTEQQQDHEDTIVTITARRRHPNGTRRTDHLFCARAKATV